MRDAPMTPDVRKALRKAIASGIVTWIFGLAFLFAAFHAWPTYKWPIGWGFLWLRALVSSSMMAVEMTHKVENTLADVAERKTRHTIVEAARRPPQDIFDEGDFWDRVNRRVADELGEPEKGPAWWKATGTVAAVVVADLLMAIVGLGIMMGLTGS